MPFGAAASVFAFNKVSRAIWSILVRKFMLYCTVFYDDFPVVAHKDLSDLTTGLLNCFLDLLGWAHATTGKKATPFDSLMTVLGVQHDLKCLHLGTFVVQNKPGRLARIVNMLEAVKKNGKFSKNDAAVLMGLLNFAGRFVLGRALKWPIRQLAAHASWGSSPTKVVAFCEGTLRLIQDLKPRRIRAAQSEISLTVRSKMERDLGEL